MDSETPKVRSMSGIAMSPNSSVVRATQIGTATPVATTGTVMATAQVSGERKNGFHENVPANSGPPSET